MPTYLLVGQTSSESGAWVENISMSLSYFHSILNIQRLLIQRMISTLRGLC